MPSATLRERCSKLGWVSSESYMKKEKFESSITHRLHIGAYLSRLEGSADNRDVPGSIPGVPTNS